MALTHLESRFDDEAVQSRQSRSHDVFFFSSVLMLKWQKDAGGRRSGARRGRRVVAESDSDPGAAAEEEEAEEAAHAGAGSVLAAGEVNTLRTLNIFKEKVQCVIFGSI